MRRGVRLWARGAYRWWGSPQALGEAAPLSGDTAMPMPDHGTDMQAAIGKLAEKLRQHPDDPEGWALLGRTYKATQHYAEARDAFRHALEAAPGDADLAVEYAAAETPADAGSAIATAPAAQSSGVPDSSARIVVKVALDPKLKDGVEPT